MKKLISTLTLPLAILTLGAFSTGARAQVTQQTYSGAFPGTISGTLRSESSVLEESFNIGANTDFQAYTTSYNAGGFQSNLTLFNAAGNYVGSSGPAGTSPFGTGVSDLDAYITESGLAAGKYTLALTDFELNQSVTATNLSDGFTSNIGDGTTFVDQNGLTRTGAYSLTLNETAVPPVSSVPEPATAWLVLPFAFAALFVRKHLGFSN